MLVTIPFCARDKALAVRLAAWIAELGGVSKHDCLLIVHKDTDSAGVLEPLRAVFGRIAEHVITDEMIVEREQHTYAANLMWKRTANHIADMNESQPWLWLEVDCTPVPPADGRNWLDAITAEYAACGKPFMHCLVETARGKSNSGCGVYPAKVRDYTDRLWQLSDVSWDVLLYDDFKAHTHYTPLIQDVGFLKDGVTVPTFPDESWLPFLRTDGPPGSPFITVLFHRCKDGTLIDRLRERRPEKPAALASAPAKSGDGAPAVRPSLTPAQPLPNDRDELLERIARLESLLTSKASAQKANPKAKKKRHVSPERKKQLSNILAKAREKKAALAVK